MQPLFKALYTAPGKHGYFDVYDMLNGSFYLKLSSWHQYQTIGHEPITIFKRQNRKWVATNDADNDIAESVGQQIEEYGFYKKYI